MIGIGVLKGMWVTLRQFIGTYPAGRWLLKRAGLPEGDGLCTIEYPEVKQQHAERHRVFPFLVYDATPDNLRCVACKICEQECPPQCIHIVGPAKDEQGRPLKTHGRTYPLRFDIDVSICMSCRICVDVCPFDAIEMDNAHEISSGGRFQELNYTKEQLLKSADYFQKIKPTEAAVVDQRLAAKAKKSAPPSSS
ncbi:MAG: 4Fe-4S dicluster domain-containing protein [Candidatus Omnitrophica bacterium]|nr:4Fe-4S dicluster domain-containing protein [Candidatus Omnitrophota bacterium]